MLISFLTICELIERLKWSKIIAHDNFFYGMDHNPLDNELRNKLQTNES